MAKTLPITIIALTLTLFFLSTVHVAYAATNTNATLPTVQGSDIVINLVNQNPDPATAGNPVALRLGIQNQGQNAKQNLDVEVIPSYPFETLSGESAVQTINSLGYQVDQNVQILKFDMLVDPLASAGTYELKVWTYADGNRNTHTETTIPVRIENLQNVQVIYVDKAVLVPGQVTPLTFTIYNVGKSPLNHVKFSWSNTGNLILPVNGATDRYVDFLDIGKSVNVTYNVIASTNANPDLYALNLVLGYDNPVSGGQSQFATVAGVYIGGGTDFAVSFDSSNGGATAFNIANTGSNPASAVAITIPNQTGWRVSGSRTSVIGSLAKGDYTIASFNLAGAGRQPLQVNVAYTDTMGNRLTESYDVDMNGLAAGGNMTGFVRTGAGGTVRTTGTPASTIVLELLIAIIVIGGIIFGIYKYRGKSKR